MENKNLNCACDSCEDCETCSIEKDAEDSSEEETEDQAALPVAMRDYAKEIDAYLSFLVNGSFGKLYNPEAKNDSLVYSKNGSSFREHMWVIFSTVVGLHLREYAVPQYGDAPTDQLYKWDANQCIKQIGKYVARMDSNARGEEEKLTDLLKIAHYASVAWMKLRGYEELFAIEMPADRTREDVLREQQAIADESVEETNA